MSAVIAVLGGDEREHHIAMSLALAGHRVRVFAGSRPDGDVPYERARSARQALDGASWAICPYPGLGVGGDLYAPAAARPVRLDHGLLTALAENSGQLILGRASPDLYALCGDIGVPVHETKTDPGVTLKAATAVAEGLLTVLIERSERLLREHLFVVLGFGSTGFAITQTLLSLRCEVIVAARSARDRELARQLGARPVGFGERVVMMESADIVINTVPDPEAVPAATGTSRTTAKIIDIASPPGGMNHQGLIGHGLDVSWVRGLGGIRAPQSMAEAQLSFIKHTMQRPRDIPSITTAPVTRTTLVDPERART